MVDHDRLDDERVTAEESALVRFQARTVGWWLASIGMVLAFLTVFVAMAGLVGIGALRGMQDDARWIVQDIQEHQAAIKQTAERTAASEQRVVESLQKTLTYTDRLEAAGDEATEGLATLMNRAERLTGELQDKLASSSPSEAASDSSFLELVRALGESTPDDHRIVGAIREGQLADESTDTFQTSQLSRGGEYLVVGICDENCWDLDLKAYDTDFPEEILDQDVEGDDVPILQFSPPEGGRLAIEVSMFHCRAPLCNWAVQVYERNDQ